MNEMFNYVNQEMVNSTLSDEVHKVIQDNADFRLAYHITEILTTIILVLKH
jgi:hypothetical protein